MWPHLLEEGLVGEDGEVPGKGLVRDALEAEVRVRQVGQQRPPPAPIPRRRRGAPPPQVFPGQVRDQRLELNVAGEEGRQGGGEVERVGVVKVLGGEVEVGQPLRDDLGHAAVATAEDAVDRVLVVGEVEVEGTVAGLLPVLRTRNLFLDRFMIENVSRSFQRSTITLVSQCTIKVSNLVIVTCNTRFLQSSP